MKEFLEDVVDDAERVQEEPQQKKVVEEVQEEARQKEVGSTPPLAKPAPPTAAPAHMAAAIYGRTIVRPHLRPRLPAAVSGHGLLPRP